MKGEDPDKSSLPRSGEGTFEGSNNLWRDPSTLSVLSRARPRLSSAGPLTSVTRREGHSGSKVVRRQCRPLRRTGNGATGRLEGPSNGFPSTPLS